MRITTSLLVIILGTAFTVVADQCTKGCEDNVPTSCQFKEGFQACLCKDEVFQKALPECLKKCDPKEASEAQAYIAKICKIYEQPEEYPGQACVEACGVDLIRFTKNKCKNTSDWDCLCDKAKYLNGIQYCFDGHMCNVKAVKKWDEQCKKCKKCKTVQFKGN
ncbi:hypothetical protein WG66_015018 [Moniliophthora roreri]|nr:hypothetical protein WG66_015018 [Moniliophthora roreri]